MGLNSPSLTNCAHFRVSQKCKERREFPNKSRFGDIYFKLELDLRDRAQQVCQSQQSLLLPDIEENFLDLFQNISSMQEFKNAKKELRNLAKSRGETIRVVDLYNSGIIFNKERFELVGKPYQ